MFSSIIRDGLTYHGISVSGRGVFTDGRGKDRETYAGQIKDGLACGLGVLACPGSTIYAEYGPDGKCDGRYLCCGYGLTGYIVFERGANKERGWTYSASEGDYDLAFCARDDPRLLALIARVAPVEALANAAAQEAKEAVACFVTELPRRRAGLDIMVTVLLARYRQPPTVASELAEKLITLPSGVLAVVFDSVLR